MSEQQLSEDQVTSLPKSLIQVGIPIEFPIYDIHGRLLMAAGTIVATEEQLERLLERGLYLNKKSIEQLRAGRTKAKGDGKKDDEKEAEPPQKLVDLSLDSIRLGETIQISPTADETDSTKYFVKFLGGLEKTSMICTAPTQDEKLVFVKEHAGFKVQLFSGREIYNFNTTVSAVLSKPFHHIHLHYPRGVYAKKLRNNQRFTTSIICSIDNNSDGEFKDLKTSGRIVDISLGGAMIESSKRIGTINDDLECTFKLSINGTEMLFSIPSTLRNIIEPSEKKNTQKYNNGIQFKEIPFQEKTMLQNYILQLFTGKDLSKL